MATEIAATDGHTNTAIKAWETTYHVYATKEEAEASELRDILRCLNKAAECLKGYAARHGEKIL